MPAGVPTVALLFTTFFFELWPAACLYQVLLYIGEGCGCWARRHGGMVGLRALCATSSMAACQQQADAR